MDGLTITPKQVMEYGMGVISFCVLIWIVMQIYKKIDPRLNKIEQDQAVIAAQSQEVVRNNTAALQNQVEANNNVAHALELISKAMDNTQGVLTQTCAILERHDRRAEDMQGIIYQIKTSVDLIHKN